MTGREGVADGVFVVPDQSAAKECDVPAASLLRYCYLAYFSRPKSERALYEAVRKAKAASIVELGIGSAQRATRLIEVAQRYRPDAVVRYTGIDLFEARDVASGGLSLKQAHQVLGDRGAKVQLVPGDPFAALSRVANTLTGTDLLLISADQERTALAKAWFYVPRMLHERSLVYVEEQAAKGELALRLLAPTEVAALAAAASVRSAKRAA